MRKVRILTCLSILCFAFTNVFSNTNIVKKTAALADSVTSKVGTKEFSPYFKECMKLARETNDTIVIERIYNEAMMHYYRSGEADSLKLYTYEYMDWCQEHGKPHLRYQYWRQYIQQLTEKGMQDEAISETELLRKDAATAKSNYGLACSEMCIGYNHRVFSNDVKRCLDYYHSALKHFEESGFFEDAYVVSLNIVQIYLARAEYANAINALNIVEQLEQTMHGKNIKIRAELMLRYYQFRVIATLASKGKNAAGPYIQQTDRFYAENPNVVAKDAWYGYKILCARTQDDLNTVLHYLDSLQVYHQSIGSCYPSNYLMKAQCLEQLGRFPDACAVYKEYVHLNDSIRSAELDDQLSKYTVQFEVYKLEKEKLELKAEVNKNRFIASLVIGALMLVLLITITYHYLRTLKMNRKLDAANKAVVRASHMKSSFIQHITHEIRTPLNSIVGFSSLMVSGGLDEEESQEYSKQVETNNAYLLELINNVIDIADMDSQTDALPKKPVNVDACCQECLEIIRRELKPDIELEYHPSSIHTTLQTVYPWMKRVLSVLLSNANKFTDSGFIRLSYEEDKTNRLVCFVVEDSGSGVDEKHKDMIFERFLKVDNFTRGTGLGLSIAKQIMEIVDGRIYLDTNYTGGARFVVEWPI